MKSATNKEKFRVVGVLFSGITGTHRKANNSPLHEKRDCTDLVLQRCFSGDKTEEAWSFSAWRGKVTRICVNSTSMWSFCSY